VGKKIFARDFASYILCYAPQNHHACGNCRACHLQQAHSHPDFTRIEPEEGGQFIKIDQIREAMNVIHSTAVVSEYRVILIVPASAMNTQSANALLKTLEEPPPHTLFMLICDQSLRLPATITSRCQKIVFPIPDREMALTWLQSQVSHQDKETLSLALNIAEGAPLQARDFLMNDTMTLRQDLYEGLVKMRARQMDPLLFSTQWEEKNIKILLHFLLIWLQDLLRFQLTQSQAHLTNSDYYTAIHTLAGKLARENLLQYYDTIQKSYAHISSAMNMNRSLLLKEIFIRWVQLC